MPSISSSYARIPPDIATATDGGAPQATLEEAAEFAWREFIALTWPAVEQTGATNTRDTADTDRKYGDSKGGPLVWETFRHRIEIYPGTQTNYTPGAYDDLPEYNYAFNPSTNQPYEACPSSASISTPWVNLDENSEIGLAKLFAGEDPGVDEGSNEYAPQFLYLAKANRAEYNYVTNQGEYASKSRSRWNGTLDNKLLPPTQATINNLIATKDNATPGSTTEVSFPNNTIELKSAWRKLSSGGELNDDASHFHTAPVRFYEPDPSTGEATCYVDDDSETWGMAALHIIQKTPTAPYFIYATFSQSDNLRDTKGNPVEDVTGKYTGSTSIDPLTPNIESTPASSYTSLQGISPTTADSTPGKSVYYQNEGAALTAGTVTVNKREVDIPATIQDVNANFQSAIQSYNTANNITESPWEYYKLVNVQYVPIDKKAGVEYDGTSATINSGGGNPIDIGSYYLSNDVVETDYTLQKFSGVLQKGGFCINGQNTLLKNTTSVGNYDAKTAFNNCVQAVSDSGICTTLGLTGDDLTKCQQKGKLPDDKFKGLMSDYVTPDYLVSSETGNLLFSGSSEAKNVFWKQDQSAETGQGFNTGGCIGCHGNAAITGTDFSFILANTLTHGLQPDAIDTLKTEADLSDNFTQLFAPPQE